MKHRIEISIFRALAVLLIFGASPSGAAEIYAGEPFAEALFDLVTSSVIVAHPLSRGTELQRTDVFLMRDGRHVAITSTAQKTKEPFTVRAIQVGNSSPDSLTKQTPEVQSLSWEISEGASTPAKQTAR